MTNSVAKIKKVERGMLYFAGEPMWIGVQPANDKKFTLAELQLAVGGCIEAIRPAVKGRQVWANEEGLLKQLPPNEFTSTFADMKVYALNGYAADWKVRGNVLKVFKREESLDTRSIDTIKTALAKHAEVLRNEGL